MTKKELKKLIDSGELDIIKDTMAAILYLTKNETSATETYVKDIYNNVKTYDYDNEYLDEDGANDYFANDDSFATTSEITGERITDVIMIANYGYLPDKLFLPYGLFWKNGYGKLEVAENLTDILDHFKSLIEVWADEEFGIKDKSFDELVEMFGVETPDWMPNLGD